ncbi:ABC transporter substrate-binding protein [Jiangella anatolica]|uniref:Amino acid ABC transporter substrate-binding protein n=1 Tax=Jiangella anatolica TaxID=2670374 RepID=A0A2W2C2H2_9ACTN|nr:ABC transporter substrate-binding protein [Jiangella anatolica]PZF86308.1 amino acid ABC transporter substrate-binding protein [Jiangella anatolica]
MNARTALAAVAALVLGAAGCSGDDDSAGGDTGFGECEPSGEAGSIELDPVVDGQLTVVTALPNPGWWNGTSPDDLVDGFEMCMVAEIAHRAGLERMEVRNLSWDQYISGSFTDYDIGATVTGITEERKQVFAFSEPYYASNISVTLAAGSTFDESTIRDARIATIQASTNAQWLADVLKPAQEPRLFSDGPEMFAALAANQVDAVITDTETALTQGKPYEGKIEVVAQYETGTPWGMVMPLDSPNVDAVDQAVADMRADGTFDRLSEDYLVPLFGVDPASIPFWAAP